MLIAVSLLVGDDAVAVGERAAGLLDEEADGGDVVGRDADGVDGDVEGALGDEGVLPEVAEAAGPAGVLGEADERRRQPELVPAVVERDADLGVGDRVDRRHAAAAGRRRTSRRPRDAHHRRPSAGADTTPTTTPSSAWARAISVAHTGMPRT